MYRIGIDVGGTFTKAVAIHSKTLSLAGKATVPTTYDTEGISDSIVNSLTQLLTTTDIQPVQVELVSFSTTHAVNALLEGDVTPVGIIALAHATERAEVIKRTKLEDLELNHGKRLKTLHRFLDITEGLDPEEIKATLQELVEEGARAVVVSEAFGVDEQSNEDRVREAAEELYIPCVAGHEISGTYGLEIRTITAAINAAILPRMIQVAERLEESIRETGITAPVMVMKCDGGLAPLEILKTKPLLTILSGPAASVVGTHLYTQLLNGIIIEVGGTTTNISVVKNGKPEMRYIDVLGHPTTIRSMDVRILPVGGGDMVQVKGRKIIEVGPRSARIAGLPYAVFEDPQRLSEATVKPIAPRAGDPENYIALETPQGRLALTLTCASNHLTIPPEGDYARGERASADAAMRVLAAHLRREERRVAEDILNKTSKKIENVVRGLMKEYKLSPQSTHLIGVGGGASVIVPYTAEKIGLTFELPENREVISSAGVAMALVREEIEKNIDEYSEGEVIRLVEETRDLLVRRGALPETINLSTEYIPEMKILRVTATGSIAGSTHNQKMLGEEEMKKLAAKILKGEGELAAETQYYQVYTRTHKRKTLFFNTEKQSVVVLDRLGRMHLHLEKGTVINGDKHSLLDTAKHHLSHTTIAPGIYVVSDSRVIDLSALTKPAQILSALADLTGKPERMVVLSGR